MESIYYVICWHCHRRCKHCYEDKFHPYIRDELEQVVEEAITNFPKIIDNLPASMMYDDWHHPDEQGQPVQRRGRIILSGGDVLTDPVREPVLYPILEALQEKYHDAGGINVVVQTTGDLVTPKILQELLDRGLWMLSIAGMDDYHVGLQGDKKFTLMDKLLGYFNDFGMIESGSEENVHWFDQQGPVYSSFGATDDSWIGKLWPRGRAWENNLSKATLTDNFCNAWSGGLNFLEYGKSGSEISIDPTGNFYPCCIKTAAPLGNLTEEPLQTILDDLQGLPELEAINAGKPERMGLSQGVSVSDFYGNCHTQKPNGDDYNNLCIGCDQFFEHHLGDTLKRKRAARLAQQRGLVAINA